MVFVSCFVLFSQSSLQEQHHDALNLLNLVGERPQVRSLEPFTPLEALVF